MGNYEFKTTIEREYNIDIAANTSQIDVGCYFRRTDASFTNYNLIGTAYWRTSIDNIWASKVYYTFDHRGGKAIPKNQWIYLGFQSWTVPRDGYGNKTVSICSEIHLGGGVGFETKVTPKVSVSLSTIPQATYISSIKCTDIGEPVVVSSEHVSPGVTHHLYYRLNDIGEWVNVPWGSFTIPLSKCSDIPNSSNAILNLKLKTFQGGTQIGRETFNNAIINVPQNVTPKASIILTDSHPDETLKFKTLISGISEVNIKVKAEGVYGSTVKISDILISSKRGNGGKYDIAVGNTASTKAYCDQIIYAKVRDSRGRTIEVSKSVDSLLKVVPYKGPSANFEVLRSTFDGTPSDTGDYICVKGNVFSSNINNINTCNVYITVDQEGGLSSLYSKEFTTVANGKESFFKILDIPIDTDKTYIVTMVLRDDVPRSSSYRDQQVVGTCFQLIDFNSSTAGMAIGKVSEYNNALECELPLVNGLNMATGSRGVVNVNGDSAIRITTEDFWDPNTMISDLITKILFVGAYRIHNVPPSENVPLPYGYYECPGLAWGEKQGFLGFDWFPDGEPRSLSGAVPPYHKKYTPIKSE